MIHIAIIIIIFICLFIVTINETIKWSKYGWGYGLIFLFCMLFFQIVIGMVLIIPMVVIDNDKKTIEGKIEAVEKNFGGTYTITIKTDKREKYCAENKDIIEMAQKLEGRKVILGKGTREGIYTYDKCQEAPIIHIEKVK